MLKLFNMFGRGDVDEALSGDADDGERRNFKRHHVDAQVLVEVDSESHQCQIFNVGPGGALLSPGFDVEVGRAVTIRLPNSRVAADAGVTRIGSDGVGIQFDDDTVGAIVAGWTKGLID